MDNSKSKFKAPSWVGNLCQKFESICEDVDGISGQDRVKYVGDQVQTVEKSMKNFCSVVMQDLVIPLAEKKDLITSQVFSKKDEIQSVFLKRYAAKSPSLEQVEGFEKIDQAIDTQPLEKEVDAISLKTNDSQLLNPLSPVDACVPASPLSIHKMEESPLHLQQDENNEVIEGLLEEKSPLELSGSEFTGENDASSRAVNEHEASSCWESDIKFDDSASHLFEEEEEDQVNESPLEEKSSPSEVLELAFTCVNYASSCANNERESSLCRESDIEHNYRALDLNHLEKNQVNRGSLDDKSSSLDLSQLVFTCVNYASSLANIEHEPSSCRESNIELKEHASDSHQLKNNHVNEGSLEEKSLPSEELDSAFTCVDYVYSFANSEHETSSCGESDIGLSSECASDSHQHVKNQVHEGSLEKKLSSSEELKSVFTCINYVSFCANSDHEPSSCRESDIEPHERASDSHQHLKNQVNEGPLEEKSSPSEVLESVFTCISYASSCANGEQEPLSCQESGMDLNDCASDSNQHVNVESQINEGPLDNKLSSLELSESVFTVVNGASSLTRNEHEGSSCWKAVIEFDDIASYSHQEERNEANEVTSEEKLSPLELSELVVTRVNDASACANNEHVASSYSESDIEFDDNELAVVGKPEDFVDGTMETCMETISLQDEVKYPGSCAIVDSNVFDTVSHTAKNFRSYKKKFCDAFTSKRRLAKEYKHLGIWYGDIDAEIECSLNTAGCSLPSVHANLLESNKLPNEELCDWQLL